MFGKGIKDSMAVSSNLLEDLLLKKCNDHISVVEADKKLPAYVVKQTKAMACILVKRAIDNQYDTDSYQKNPK